MHGAISASFDIGDDRSRDGSSFGIESVLLRYGTIGFSYLDDKAVSIAIC
jgi:hypothetical protein